MCFSELDVHSRVMEGEPTDCIVLEKLSLPFFLRNNNPGRVLCCYIRPSNSSSLFQSSLCGMYCRVPAA
jgi:hypothetical protein